MRVKPGDREARRARPKSRRSAVAVVRAASTIIWVVSIAIEARSEACTVTGTTRKCGTGQHHDLLPDGAGQRGEESVWPG